MNMTEPVILVNCMNNDVRVLVNDEPVLLPRGIKPTLLSQPSRPIPSTVNVIDMNDTGNRELMAEILLYTAEEAIGVLRIPPYIPGVWNLVEPEIIQQFPWRDDFVTPAVWEYIGDLSGDYIYDMDENPDDVDDDTDEDAESVLEEWNNMVLAGVTRAPFAVATPDTPVLELE